MKTWKEKKVVVIPLVKMQIKKRRVSGTLAGIWCASKTFALRVSLLVLGPEKGLLASNEAAMQSAV